MAELAPGTAETAAATDPNDERNIFLEVRAGTGGAEAALFSGDLLRMYMRFAELQRWRTEIISESEGEHGGYKGSGGAHQRPGRVFAPEVRIRRSPGSARARDRITRAHPHLRLHRRQFSRRPQRSRPSTSTPGTCASTPTAPPAQVDNTSTRPILRFALPTFPAVWWWNARTNVRSTRTRPVQLSAAAKLKASAEAGGPAGEAENAKLQVGSGDRSERIRTYNSQNRLTDHRVNLTLYKLDEVMMGAVDQVIEPLMQEYQAEQLASLAEDA